MRRVVLLGGGYVTLHAYAALARRLGGQIRRGDVELVVVSADDCHSFHGFTGEVLAGVLPFERTRTPLVEACPLATVVHARATHVDPQTRTVTVEPVGTRRGGATPAGTTRQITYDELVVGTGGREPVSCVPGLAEHGYTLRGVGEIEALVEHLRLLLADVGTDRRTVVVAGGGIAGTELAAAVADVGRGRLEVVLVHPGDRLLPELRASHPRLAGRAERELHRLGVRTMLRTRLREVTPHGAVLTREDAVPARGDDPAGTVRMDGTVLATIGQVPVALPGLGHLPRDARGRLLAAPDLSVTDGVWAAGDAARVLHPRTGEPVPANALWAIKAGAHAGGNVARRLEGRPTRPFAYRGLGQAASYGVGRSIADLYGLELTGGLAWALRMAFFLRFMPSRRRAAQVVLDLAPLLAGRPPGERSRTSAAGRDAIPVPARVG